MGDGTYYVYATITDGNSYGSSCYAPGAITIYHDIDGDGMSDDWEMEYFGTLDRDGDSDFDGDGISDLNEYLNGTNPVLRIVIPGDIDDSKTIDLRDAILALQVFARIDSSSAVYKESDISGDGKIGIEEAVYILQIVSCTRDQ